MTLHSFTVEIAHPLRPPPLSPATASAMMSSAVRRIELLRDHLAPTYWGRSDAEVQSYRQLCLRLREELRTFINGENCAPILVRLAWHDSGTFDASVRAWPACGGANG